MPGKQNFLIKLCLGLVIVILLVTAGYYFGAKQQTIKYQSPSADDQNGAKAINGESDDKILPKIPEIPKENSEQPKQLPQIPAIPKP